MKLGTPALDSDVHLGVLQIGRDRGIFAARCVELVELPRGTRGVTRAIEAGEVDVGVGLTDGLLRAAAGDGGLKLVATAVRTPLRWVVLVRAGTPWGAPADLRTRRIGITCPGGGAHLAALVLARAEGWRDGVDFVPVPLGDLESLVEGLKSDAIDAFLWEEMACHHLVDRSIVKAIGGVAPGWPSFAIAARTPVIEARPDDVRAGVAAFQALAEVFDREPAYAHALAVRRYHLGRDDAERWWSAVRYSADGAISLAAITSALETLETAGVVAPASDAAALVAPGFAPVG